MHDETVVYQVWAGVVTSPVETEDEAVPRTVSMTWDDACNVEVSMYVMFSGRHEFYNKTPLVSQYSSIPQTRGEPLCETFTEK